MIIGMKTFIICKILTLQSETFLQLAKHSIIYFLNEHLLTHWLKITNTFSNEKNNKRKHSTLKVSGQQLDKVEISGIRFFLLFRSRKRLTEEFLSALMAIEKSAQ